MSDETREEYERTIAAAIEKASRDIDPDGVLDERLRREAARIKLISLDTVSTADLGERLDELGANLLAMGRSMGKTQMVTEAMNELARRFAAGEPPDIESCGFPRTFPALIDRNAHRVVPVSDEMKGSFWERYVHETTETRPDQNRPDVCVWCNGEGWHESTCNHTYDWPYGEQCQVTCQRCRGTGKPFAPPPRPPKKPKRPRNAREFIKQRKTGRRPALGRKKR